jgi:CRISPR-associated endonuclease Csn1
MRVKMKKVLGLDLGIASIGWALIAQDRENEEVSHIIDCGVRIVPLSTDERSEFAKGGSVPTNHVRRRARGMRRNLQRYRWRRHRLYRVLEQLGMMPDQRLMTRLSPVELYSLRSRALSEPLSLQEIGRILIHLNNWRGYRSNRRATVKDDEKSQYLKEIKNNEDQLKVEDKTIGQFFAERLHQGDRPRIRGKIFSRNNYIDEFNRIWDAQAQYHPSVLTEEHRRLIRDRIIYYQRPLKSAKGLVGTCALEWYYALDKETHQPKYENGRKKIVRPKCAPKSSPLNQECKVWESIHNLRIYRRDNNGRHEPQPVELTLEQKKRLFEELQKSPKNLEAKEVLHLLGFSAGAYEVDDHTLENNRTLSRLKEVFKRLGIRRDDLLKFDPAIEEVEWDDLETGERRRRLQVRGDFDREPLYQLWHLIYATEEEGDLIRVLEERYGFTTEQAREIAKIDFTSEGYARKSHRALRRLLPHYRKGLDYTKACEAAGYRHADYITKAENEARALSDRLKELSKNALRNPVVEKILNQMVHLVNDLMATYGRPDEVRVELARELKQSAQERKKIHELNQERNRQNEQIKKEIANELAISPEKVTRAQIEKLRLYKEINGVSLYTGKCFSRADVLNGDIVNVEHIIPRTLRFDDSYHNKTLCEANINREKGNKTACDYMRSRGAQEYEAYLKRVQEFYDRNGKGARAKYKNLTTTEEDLLKDNEFLQRQLRESQYIARKAVEMLREVCQNVYTTTGSVTDFLRHWWGWDEVIAHLRLPQFREAGLTEIISVQNGQKTKEVIKGWSKRDDHRHHALDALVVACTRQSHIQRINELSQTLQGTYGEERRQQLFDVGGRDKYIAGKAPFSFQQVCEAMKQVLVSYKQRTRVATRSRGCPKGSSKVPTTLTPRGRLHEETIYGRIRRYKKVALDGKFSVAMLGEMVHPHQRELVEARLAQHANNPKAAFKDLDKNPIRYGPNGEKHLRKVTVWEYLWVSRKALDPKATGKSLERIVDPAVRKAVEKHFKTGNVGELPFRHVRVKNPAERMIRLPRGYAEPGSNHHIAIYRDADGKKHEHVVTFWDAFQRVRIGLPPIITDVAGALEHISHLPGELPELHLPENPDWQFVVSLAQNDMFVFGLDPAVIDLRDPKNRSVVNRHLFRVRKISSGSYWFSHHTETKALDDTDSKEAGRCKQCSIKSLSGAVKVTMNRLGHIVKVGQPI